MFPEQAQALDAQESNPIALACFRAGASFAAISELSEDERLILLNEQALNAYNHATVGERDYCAKA